MSSTSTPSTSRSSTPLNIPISSRPTHDSSGNLLPGILCLHGGGSNSTVFKIQTRRLIWNLTGKFRLVFAQAPIEGIAGHGMLPTFASCAPFYRWVSKRFKIEDGEVEEVPTTEARMIDEILIDTMEENGGIASFAGVIGFSQGARLAAGLLLRQMVENRDKLGGSMFRFKFGIFVGGPYPPISIHSEVTAEDYDLLRQISTVHAWGRNDHIIEGCKKLHQQCDGDECFQMDFTGGHHMPLKDQEARDLCDLISAAWYANGGTHDSHNGVSVSA